jgi:type II secretory pathway component PulC
MLRAKKVTSWGFTQVLGREGEWVVYLAMEMEEEKRKIIEKKMNEWDKYATIEPEVFWRECNKLDIKLSGVLITEENEILAVGKGGSVLLRREERMGKLVMGSEEEMEVKKGKIKEGDELTLIAGSERQSEMMIEMQMVDWDKIRAMATTEELE